jgi:hypothetical protein
VCPKATRPGVSSRLHHLEGLNVAFLVLAAILIARFVRTGGPATLRMMDLAPADPEEHEQTEVSTSPGIGEKT